MNEKIIEDINWLIEAQQKIIKIDPSLNTKYQEGIIFGLKLAKDIIIAAENEDE